MDLKYEITCVVRSGLAEVAESSPSPGEPEHRKFFPGASEAGGKHAR